MLKPKKWFDRFAGKLVALGTLDLPGNCPPLVSSLTLS